MNVKIAAALVAASSVITVAVTPALAASPSNGRTSNTVRVAVRTSSSRASAARSPSLSSKTKKTPPPLTPAVVEAACMREAARIREEAIKTSLREFSDAMNGLLDERSQQIDKLWSMTDTKKRDNGLKSVWRSFGSAWRMLGIGMREDRRSAWDQYRKDKSDCGVPEDPEKGGLGADSQF